MFKINSWCRSVFYIVNSEHISHFFPVFFLLTLMVNVCCEILLTKAKYNRYIAFPNHFYLFFRKLETSRINLPSKSMSKINNKLAKSEICSDLAERHEDDEKCWNSQIVNVLTFPISELTCSFISTKSILWLWIHRTLYLIISADIFLELWLK